MRLGWSGKVALGAAVLVVATVAVFLAITLTRMREVAHESITESARRQAAICAQALAQGGFEPEGLRAWAVRLSVEAGARVTVIDGTGGVVVDSEVQDVSLLDNHAQRPEVVGARRDGSAVIVRYSHSVHRDLLYAAATVPNGEYVVRLARDLSAVEAELRAPAHGLWVLALAVVAVGVLAAVLLARGLARPLRELTGAAERVERGDLEARVHPRGADDVAVLGRAFNRMTERLRETLGVAEAETARLTTILDGMHEGVVALDEAERISFLNGSARAILGVKPDRDLEGTPFYEVLRDPQVLGLVQTAAGGRTVEGEIPQEGPPRRMIQVHALPVGDGGVVVVLRDMSRLRRLERMRSDFVSNVSHELRTPLASIAAAVETLLDPETRAHAEEGPRFLGMIQRNLRRLEALLNDILALSRLESRPETLPREPVDLGAVVQTAAEELETRAATTGTELSVRAGRCRVMGDAATLRRVVDNLVVNAITYTPPGGRVAVSLAAEEGEAVLRVEDTGIGIPAEDLDRIFERFYRVDKARSRSAGGTGLGLAIVKHAVGLHGGTVSVESALTRGSTFTVRIPLAQEPAPAESGDGERGERSA